MPVLIPESFRQDFHQNGSSFPLAAEQSARQRQAAIRFPGISSRRLDTLAADGKEVWRRHCSQVGIPRDAVRSLARPCGEIAFGQCLQPLAVPANG
jgi:hypothetical protein